ncbi:MAG: phosphoribosylamine--glycine ligase [Candidatus Pelagibacter sp.]|nr:phosphoribosylamine--glycine ligase [Candidatus Pelagibacter sp.]OUW23322.1 MAG: phosphoribosylamine--glycine ligase [Rickettsiales bacterium TMED174]
MNIAIIGSGGREHALCLKFFESKKISKIFCIPGNAGTHAIATNLNIDLLDFKNIKDSIKKNEIKLVIVGPELPLVKGMVDYLRKENIKVFGPSKFASKLEGSKAFVKQLCRKFKIPTAQYKICKSFSDVKIFLKKNNFPIVVKADGLAAGKGVKICKNIKQVKYFCNKIFSGEIGDSKKVVLEEFLVGEELSYFSIVDKKSLIFFGSAQDHKRVGEKDTGPNTGGMGAYSPSPLLNKKIEKKIINRIVKPTLRALTLKNKPYTGFLYTGLMIKDNDPYLIEFNVRMGDPECQVILPRIKTDILEIIQAAVENRLSNIKIRWNNLKCMTIVLCSKGYPGIFKKNKPLENLKKINIKHNTFIFHAGTKILKSKIVSSGGRVLNVTNVGTSFKKIRINLIKLLKKINWKDGFFRKDIGWRVIGK